MIPWSQFNHSNAAYSDAGFVEDPEAAHNIVFDLIDSQDKVLEVGCSVGYFAEKLMKKKQCIVFGIDIDPKAVELARQRLGNTVFLSRSGLPSLPDEYYGFFNVIVCADVIEHTVDAWCFIKDLKKYGGRHCRFIFSIPNVAHWSCRLMLLKGAWNYEASGILDYTHLRFFTYHSAFRLMDESQLEIRRIFYTSGQALEVYDRGLFRALRKIDYFKLLPWLIKRLASAFPTLFALQFVLECTQKDGS